MRYYEQIWIKLKSLPLSEAKATGVSISANRRLHKRIIKAVIKEKWMDLGYKIQMDPQKTIMYHTTRGAVLTFYLELSVKTIDTNCL